MKNFWQKFVLWALLVGAVVIGFIEKVLPLIYERRRKESAERVKHITDAVAARHEERKVETAAKVAVVEKETAELKAKDSVDLANDIINGKL
jgi:hypothetical protein